MSAKATPEKLRKRYRETGNLEALPRGGKVTAKLSGEKVAIVAQLVEEDNDATLEELCERLGEKLQVGVSRATVI